MNARDVHTKKIDERMRVHRCAQTAKQILMNTCVYIVAHKAKLVYACVQRMREHSCTQNRKTNFNELMCCTLLCMKLKNKF